MAIRRGVAIGDIAACCADIGLEVGSAGHSGGRIEV